MSKTDERYNRLEELTGQRDPKMDEPSNIRALIQCTLEAVHFCGSCTNATPFAKPDEDKCFTCDHEFSNWEPR